MPNTISIKTAKIILSLFKQGEINKKGTARKLKLSRNTIRRYCRGFHTLKILYPEKINNDVEFIKLLYIYKRTSPKKQNLMKLFPAIVTELESNNSSLTKEWIKYKSDVADGYRYTHFAELFSRWCKSEGIKKINTNKWKSKLVPESEMPLLNQWRRSKNKRKWEKAVALLDSHQGVEIRTIAKKVERHPDSIKEWIMGYKKEGINFLIKKRKVNQAMELLIKNKKENLIKLIHETPHIHGINRASWSLNTLVIAFQKKYGETISQTSMSEYLKKEGYSFRKAKEVLTSPDPLYREKLNNIKDILSNLGPKQKFFSIDEFGPFSVKMKGGRSIVKNGELKTYPQIQKSKGFLICTAALELSTNQISHFYSLKKNTKEMIRLLEVVLKEYAGEEKIFFSWDAASWHASKELYSKIEEVNSPEYRAIHNNPLVELAPLPASAQFLNIIESVFSGLAKSVIHNSNYQSVEEAKNAIDIYFKERNAHFKTNPKRAGNKIWGKEIVKPVFSEANNCKDPAWR